MVNKYDNVIASNNWGSNIYTINTAKVLDIYYDRYADPEEYLIADNDTGKHLVVYCYEVELVRTSKDWQELDSSNTIIMDPDGWDRSNYEYSFNQELITEEEYKHRKLMSTVIFVKKEE